MKNKLDKFIKENNQELDIVFILDRSGSMSGMEEDTIGGYNNYLKKYKNKHIKVTTVLFDDEYEILNYRKDINNVKKLTKNEYYVRGCTALYDAIGKTITKLEKDSNKVLFVITTDGLENASKEYDKKKINKMIKSHSNWNFMYIGANIDSYAEGSSIGIKKEYIANYQKSSKGVKNLFGAIGSACEMACSDQEINENWKKDLL